MTAKCQSCGKTIRSAVAGLCPRCLVLGALEPVAPSFRSGRGAFCPPEIAELQDYFDGYELTSLIGNSGMGAVYKARQLALERDVAIKVLPLEEFEGPEATERFRQEAVTLARLNHPNIVSVYDFGECEGFFYIVMEFVEGTDLAAILASGKLPVDRSLGLVRQVCDALQFAHDQGVVHRDIKPANILVDTAGHAKIADFGLAKVLGLGDTMMLTTEGERLGTPLYMSPEQRKSTADADHRADIYSTGVVFYELLTGELPSGNFPTPSEASGIDRRYDEVVLKAMEQKPERRYQQASEMRTRLEDIGGGRREPISLGWKVAVGMIAIAALAGIITLVWPGSDSGDNDSAERLTVAGFEVLQPDDVQLGDHVGYSLAMHGERLLVGATQGMWDERFGDGYVAVFEREAGGEWEEIHRIRDPEGGEAGSQFGYIVAGDGHVIVAAPRNDLGGGHVNSGAMFCYEAPAGSDPKTWKFVQKLTVPEPKSREYFGVYSALDRNRLVVSADGQHGGEGVLYVYDFVDGKWNLSATLEHPRSGLFRKQMRFGNLGIGLRGDVLAVGSREDGGKLARQGSLSIFEKQPGTEGGWEHVAFLNAPDTHRGQMFGSFPVFDGSERLLVGAMGDSTVKGARGAVFVIGKADGEWQVQRRIDAPAGAEYFGHSVVMNGDRLFASAHETPGKHGEKKAGAVFEYWRDQSDPTGWDLQREIRCDQAGAFFGLRIFLAPGVLAVGAPRLGLPTRRAGAVVLVPLDG